MILSVFLSTSVDVLRCVDHYDCKHLARGCGA